MLTSLKKKRKLIAITFTVSAILLWFAWMPLSIYCHLRGAERAMREMSQPLVDTGNNGPMVVSQRTSIWDVIVWKSTGIPEEPWQRYEYHRDALVNIGYFVHCEFRFDHIQGCTAEGRKLWELACTETDLMNIHTTGTGTAEPYVIDVYDTSEKIPRWERFVEAHDVPDFAERFVSLNQTVTPSE